VQTHSRKEHMANMGLKLKSRIGKLVVRFLYVF